MKFEVQYSIRFATAQGLPGKASGGTLSQLTVIDRPIRERTISETNEIEDHNPDNETTVETV